MAHQIPLGIDDFRALREQGLAYVDKTHLICELLDRPGEQVVLLPRPRRFGKSLNLSMLRYFFERSQESRGHLFEDLAVWRAGEAYRAHFQRYPVIHLSLKDLGLGRFEDVRWAMREKIRDLFDEHRAVLDSDALGALDRQRFGQILDGSAPPGLYQRALLDLSRALHRAHGEKVVILVDEYDQPVHAGHAHGYARDVLELFRAFFTAGLKDNPHLARAVLTGVLRIARESIFSGLNNLSVYTLLRPELGTCFGFTEDELRALLDRAGRDDQREAVRSWYGAYLFGDRPIYNPWSVLSFLADARAQVRPYWLLTSANDLVRYVLERDAGRLRPAIESLLSGEGIEVTLDEHVALDQLEHSPDVLWSLLVFCGYLRAEERSRGPSELVAHHLTIPNREVRMLYDTVFRSWLGTPPRGQMARSQVTRDPMTRDPMDRGQLDRDPVAGTSEELPRRPSKHIAGDAEAFEERLQSFFQGIRAAGDATPGDEPASPDRDPGGDPDRDPAGDPGEPAEAARDGER